MKFVNYVKYKPERANIVRPKHREYTAKLMAEGKLVTAGPLSGGKGGLFIYELPGIEAAQQLFDEDPYKVEGAVESYELSPWEMVGVNLDLLQ